MKVRLILILYGFLLPHALFAQAPHAPRRFDIAAGPLDAAVRQFESATGIAVSAPALGSLAVFHSPGVSGLLTPAAALEALVSGTGLVVRFTGDTAATLEVSVTPERVDVIGAAAPYRVEASATATRTDTPLRDIPQTLTIVTRDLLRDQNAQSIAGALKSVPGVTIAQGEGNRDQVVLRGISTQSDFFVDGVRDDQERFRDLYNVQSVEVLQGPAAVLFGRGGAGGIVNLVTAAPQRGAPGEFAAELGAYDHKRATAQVGGAIAAGGAFRLSVMGEDSGGFRQGFFLHRYGVNPSFSIRPGGDTSIVVGFERLYDRRLADRGIPSKNGRPVEVPAAQFFGSLSQNQATSGVDSTYATIEHRLTASLSVRNHTLVGRYAKSYQNVYAGSAVGDADTLTLSAYNHDIDRTNVFNQTDLILRTATGRVSHTLLAGVEAGHQFQDELRHTAAAIANVPLSASVRDAAFATAPIAIDRHASADVLAGYVQDQVALSARWKAVVGARLDRFAVSVEDHLPANPNLSRVDTAVSPRAGLIYQPTYRVSIYSSYNSTFLPSGQTLGLATNTAELEPENARNYEVGAKLDLLGKRLNVAAAVFRLDRNNVKNTAPDDPTRLVLTGQQRTEGVTISAAGSVRPGWTLYGGFARLDGRITRATAAAPEGRLVRLVPRNQLTLWSTYDVSPRWGGGGGLIDQSRVFTSFSNLVVLPGYTRADAVLYYRRGRYRVALNAENVLNTTYYATANGDNNISPGAPRTLQLSLRAAF
ncbi:MAG: putative TonB-dependent receptor [Acidobacteria bacterium]|nr:putative TonB-dependent receptor [Acidobacteriota bacterium]